MLIDWLLKKELKDSDSVIIRGAAVIIFALTVFVLDEIFYWQLSSLSLAVICVITGSVGFFVAKASPVLIKAIPFVAVLSLAAFPAKDWYEHYLFKITVADPFLAETDHCKVLDLQLVNKHSPVCMKLDALKKNRRCEHIIDNEWRCWSYSSSDVIAMPEGHNLHHVAMAE